ncbi:MAG: tRNA 2-selenouridine synthase [Pseudomonadota bacterium]|jgi:tRNA 2-selenouridine synthase
MKYPALLTADELLPQLDTYDSIIDVRSESEFALDHIPGAINCPVLRDAERVTVGTLYKQSSAFDAKKIGAALVARNIALHLETSLRDKPRDWKPLIYCWRGGNRSGAMAHILAKIGWHAVQLDGGYKAYRQHVTGQTDKLASALHFRVICGTTGSGKSRLLETLAATGAQVLDLEQLAAHRGSVLGNLPSAPQPSQKMFESRIWQVLRHCSTERVVFVESESKKVGNLRVPEQLMDKIRASSCVALHIETPLRVRLLMEDYAHFVANPALLGQQLLHLTSLHGHEKIKRWQAMAEIEDMETLVHELLVQHYDPAYLRSIDRNFLRYGAAQALTLADISETSFQAAATVLLQNQTVTGLP